VAAAFVHGGVIAELCRQATGSRPFAFLHADNASITRLVALADGRRLLRSFNDTAHLTEGEGYARSSAMRSSRPSMATTETPSGSAPS
jgi:probable phosphoglycerate mutase